MEAVAKLAILGRGEKVAGKVEEIGDRTVDGNEALTLPGGLETLHRPLSSANGKMRIPALLFNPLCDRCSTPGMSSFFAARMNEACR